MSKRRGHGEGAVYQRKDGRWVGTIDLGWQDGRRQRKSYYGKTQREVQSKLAAGRRHVADGLSLPSERQTVGRFLSAWLRDVADVNLRPSTAIRYRQLIERHILPTLGRRPLTRLSPYDLQALYAAKLDVELAPRTVGHIHRVLHRALADAVRWGSVVRNVCDAVSPPKVARKEMHVLNAGEVRQLLTTAADDGLEAFYVLAVTSGLRQGELLALKWRDVDLSEAKISVQRTVRRLPKLGMVESEPKSAAGRRTVRLTPLAVSALQRHRTRQNGDRLAAYVWDDRDLVFTNEIGRHIEPQNLQRRSWWPLLERAELPRIRFHDLRHTAATLMMLSGVPVKAVSEMLGHSSITLTLDTYSHVLPDMQADAASKMQTLLVAR